MKKIYIISFILSTLAIFSSCKLEDRTYQGPLFVEFSPEQYGQKASPSGITKQGEATGVDTIGVQLIGLAQPEAITVNFRVVDQIFYLINLDRYVADLPADAAPGDYQTILATGLYNVDYSFEGLPGVTFDPIYGRGSFTIAANSQFGTFPINILQKGGAQMFIVLDDSKDIRANKPTALLRYQTAIDKIILMDEPFATDPLVRGWTAIDKDGDGYNWNFYNNPPSITSDSYLDGIGPVFPENYLISPAIAIPNDAQNVALAFQVADGAHTDFRDKYKVIISENEINFDNCRDADVLQDYTELTEANADKKFTDVFIDMTAYKGKTVYIGIVHGDCTDQYYILVRNLSVYTY